MTKYRALTIDGRREVKGYYCKVEGKHYIILDDAEYDNCTPVNESYQPAIGGFVEVIPSTIAQFTGIFDKNKKEIYGSIPIDGKMSESDDVIEMWVSAPWNPEEPIRITGQIIWENGGWWFQGKESNNWDCYLAEIANDVEVIGSVAQNPELLEGE